jgi:hypothetical protein
MKRIFTFIVCAVLLLCVCNVITFAEGEEVVQEPTVGEEVVQEPTLTEQVLGYAKEHFEEIVVMVYICITSIYERNKQKANLKTIATVNNNAVDVATNSQIAIGHSNAKMEQVASVVVGYKETIEKLLSKFEESEKDKLKLEEMLAQVHNTLKASKLANMELANEVAELLVLANIPNSKKEELYSRHLAAVGAIAEAEQTEVTTNEDGQETE